MTGFGASTGNCTIRETDRWPPSPWRFGTAPGSMMGRPG
jgi:hypothetical protein